MVTRVWRGHSGQSLLMAARDDAGGGTRTIAHSTRRRQGLGERHEMHYTGHVPEAPLSQVAGSAACCGTSFRACARCSCAADGGSAAGRFVRSHLIPSRLSKCPRSCLLMSLYERPCAFRSWRNSWWMLPTIVSSSLQWTMEQHVDIPVPGRGGRYAGLQGFLPRQSSTTPYFREVRISERIVEQFAIPSSERTYF